MKAIKTLSIFLAGYLSLTTSLIADTVTIQFFLGDIPDTPAGAIGVLVADVNSDGFDSVYQAGIDGNTLNVGDTFANSDDVVIGVTTATADGFQGNDIGFADTFAPIDYTALGLSQGIPVRFFWFPSTNTGSPVVATYMGFQAFDSGINGTGGNLNYSALPAAPGVYTLTHLDTSNGGGVSEITPSPTGFTGPIATQPMNDAVDGGDSANVSVGTQGQGPFSFEWFMGPAGDTSTPVGTNSDTLNLLSLLYDSSYWVRISDSSGTINSMVANLTVNGGGLRPDFTWNAVQGAEWYNLYVQKDGALYYADWFEGNSITSWTPTSNLPIGNYTYYVRSYSAGGGYTEWVQYSSFSLGIPELLTPTGQQPSNEVRPELTWTRSLGADSYLIYLSRDGALFFTGTIQGYTNTSWQSQTDMPPGNYSYWIAPVSSETGQGPWSAAPLEFSIGIPQLTGPSGSLPDGDWKPTFTWTESPSADWYYLYITFEGSLWRAEWLEGSTNTSWQSADNMPSGNYQFWVAPWSQADGGLGPWSTPLAFSLGFSLPTPVSPDGLQNRGVWKPEFTWTGGGKNEWFQFYLARNGSLFADPWVQGPITSWTPSEDLASGDYQWWMRGWNSADGTSVWVQGPDFQIQGLAPLTPTGLTQNLQPRFEWDAEPGATWYRLYVADTAGTVFFFDWLEGITFWDPPSNLSEGNHVWWIQSYHPTRGIGAWLGPHNFEIQAPAPIAPDSTLLSGSGVGSIEVASNSDSESLADFSSQYYQSASRETTAAIFPGDLNEDGMGDLILQDRNSGEARVVFLDGSSRIGESQFSIQAGDPDWKIVGHGDMDNDLDNDLVWQKANTGEVTIWLIEDSTTVVGSPSLSGLSIAAGQRIVGVTDIDGDFDGDLLVQSQDGALTAIELESFSVESQEVINHGKSSDWVVDLAIDLDGDGNTEIFWRHQKTGQLDLPVQGTPSSLGSNNRLVAAQDINNDGEIDLLIQDVESGQLTAWLIAGGVYASAEALTYQPDSAAWEARNSRPLD